MKGGHVFNLHYLKGGELVIPLKSLPIRSRICHRVHKFYTLNHKVIVSKIIGKIFGIKLVPVWANKLHINPDYTEALD